MSGQEDVSNITGCEVSVFLCVCVWGGNINVCAQESWSFLKHANCDFQDDQLANTLSYPGFLCTVPFKQFIALVAQQNEEGRVEGKEGEFGERE